MNDPSVLERFYWRPDLPARQRVNLIESLIRGHPEAVGGDEIPLFHHFSPGLYWREVRVKSWMLTIGKIHKYACTNILLKGERSTLIGENIVRVKAPFIYVSPPGTKRISYTHTDCIWITVHETEETDIPTLENDLVAETEQEYQDFCRAVETEQRKCLS